MECRLPPLLSPLASCFRCWKYRWAPLFWFHPDAVRRHPRKTRLRGKGVGLANDSKSQSIISGTSRQELKTASHLPSGVQSTEDTQLDSCCSPVSDQLGFLNLIQCRAQSVKSMNDTTHKQGECSHLIHPSKQCGTDMQAGDNSPTEAFFTRDL